ncbi:hypothetical protein [Rhizobium mayense]|uniref:Uncharacterized protein n=1 Tax=Rhizobium mayense TaxID=1312184 RepID=A0ABT7JM90_9HYPH|nr:hypothetical protein [Rhizobium mayense]MDL2397464.1 hypothetical protein [Rhizobium mayense]
MIDVASLGVAIDTSNVRIATGDLKAWNAETGRTEKATGAAARAVDDMNGKVRVAGGVIAKANAEVAKFGAANGKTTASLTSTYAVAQLNNTVPPSAQATANSVKGTTLDVSRPTGYSNFDFIRDHASQAGEPLRKSEAQEAGEAIDRFWKLVSPIVRDPRVNFAANQGDNILVQLLRETDFNKQAEAFDQINQDYKEKKDRSERSPLPQFQKDAEDAKKMLSVASTIYESRT